MKKELNKTKNEIEKLNNNIVNNNLKKTQRQVEIISEGIFQILSKKIHPNKKNKLTIGQKTSDWLTKWAGSWTFIISFLLFLVFWMFLNTYFWIKYKSGQPFDPFPFILLNLLLSTLAALQAPIILMSQNRAAQRDRIRAEYDYKVNRTAAKEIREIKKILEKVFKK